MFFTFYGLGLLKKNLDLKVSPLGNAAMEMPMAGGHMKMPNLVGMLPGVTNMTSSMMKGMIKKKGVAFHPRTSRSGHRSRYSHGRLPDDH